jgi:hypothetical protein
MVQNGSGDTTKAMNALIGKLAKAESEQDKSLYLGALGNTGDARALAAIQGHLKDASVPVRAAATYALRFIADETADDAIIAALADAELDVQKAAVGTLDHRPIAPMLAAVKTMLDSDIDSTVRKGILNGLRSRKQELAWLSDNGATPQEAELARALRAIQ